MDFANSLLKCSSDCKPEGAPYRGRGTEEDRPVRKETLPDIKDEKEFMKIFFSQEQTGSFPSQEEDLFQEPIPSTLGPVFIGLMKHIQASLTAMKAFAFFSRDKFIDAKLGEHFYRVVSEDIEKTVSLLNCFCNYLHFSTPVPKADTVHTLLEESLRKHKGRIEEKKIKIVKKQFEKDLPETTVPDAQLSYILDSIIEQTVQTLPYSGGMAFLTKSFEPQDWEGDEKRCLQKDEKYIEVLIVSTRYQKQNVYAEISPEISNNHHEEGMDLVLELAKQVVQNNHGVVRVKFDEEKGMTFIYLILPVERRKMFDFLPPGDREKRQPESGLAVTPHF